MRLAPLNSSSLPVQAGWAFLSQPCTPGAAQAPADEVWGEGNPLTDLGQGKAGGGLFLLVFVFRFSVRCHMLSYDINRKSKVRWKNAEMANFPSSLWMQLVQDLQARGKKSPHHPPLANKNHHSDRGAVCIGSKLFASETCKLKCVAGATETGFERAPRGRKLQRGVGEPSAPARGGRRQR